MKNTRNSLTVIALVVAVALLAASSATAAKIVIEAEHYRTISPSMAKATSQVASGSAYIHIPLKRPHATTEGGASDTGNTQYKINVPQAGSYVFWGRAHWYDGCGNSFFLKIDDKPSIVFGNDGTYRRWHWVKGVRVTLTAGPHTIRIQNREDGAKLDQFMLTTNRRYVPVRPEKETKQYIIPAK